LLRSLENQEEPTQPTESNEKPEIGKAVLSVRGETTYVLDVIRDPYPDLRPKVTEFHNL
jgi:hypothetical protein